MKGLKMDTSNSKVKRPVDHLMGEGFSQDQFNQEDWMRILTEIFDELKPRLKYLSGMLLLKDFFNRSIGSRMVIQTSNKHLSNSIPQALKDEGKCLRLVSCDFGQAQRKPENLDSAILISLQGQFFKMVTTCTIRRGHGGNIVCETKTLYIVPIRLSDLDMTRKTRAPEDTLSGLDSFDQCVGASILEGFYQILKETLDRKMVHIREMEAIASDIRRKMEHFNCFSTRFVLEDGQ